MQSTAELTVELQACSAAIGELEAQLERARASRDDRIARASDQGLSLRAIAAAAGINHVAVRNILQKRAGGR